MVSMEEQYLTARLEDFPGNACRALLVGTLSEIAETSTADFNRIVMLLDVAESVIVANGGDV